MTKKQGTCDKCKFATHDGVDYVCINPYAEFEDKVAPDYSCERFKANTFTCKGCGEEITLEDLQEEQSDGFFEGWFDGKLYICGDCYADHSKKDLEEQLEEVEKWGGEK
jgi:hypothetical protein